MLQDERAKLIFHDAQRSMGVEPYEIQQVRPFTLLMLKAGTHLDFAFTAPFIN